MESSEENLEARREEERRPVEEAGGGESEGFEQAERELVEQAENFDQHRSPRRDAFEAEENPIGRPRTTESRTRSSLRSS